MQRYFDELAQYERDGFTIIVDKTYEDIDPSDLFDDSVSDIKQIYEDINSGQLEWFMLRVRVLVEGLELAEEYLGGCLYKDAREVLTDGTADDIIDQALTNAKPKIYHLSRTFAALSDQVDREACID
jgi:hypothetical protein